jgi:membrane-bound hydrogenase subunit beta
MSKRRTRPQLDYEKLQGIAARTGARVVINRRSIVLSITPDKVQDVLRLITTELPDFYHLSTITAVDVGTTIDLIYHFWKEKDFLSVRTAVPKENPVVESVSEFLPSSLLYEAEVKDLLGISFTGNPLMGRKLLLPDSYPAEAPPPLRKEADPEKIRKMMELE